MNLATLQNLLTKFRYGDRLDPLRDWLILISFGGVVLAGIIGWNIWTFEMVAQGGVIGSASIETPPVFSRSSLETVQNIFTDRAAEEAKYDNGTYRFADPSQ